MSSIPIDIITISREFGAGGSSVAAALSAQLGWRVLDRDLAQQVADRLRLDRDVVEKFDEQSPSLLARMASALLISSAEAPTPAPPTDVPHHEAIAESARALIEEAGRSPPLIVVGHGGQAIFRGRRGTFHVRLVAPIAARIQRVCTRLPCTLGQAEAQVRRVDADRHDYLRRYFAVEWRDEMLYDLQINTGNISIEDAAELIVQAVGLQAVGQQTVDGRR
jgi:cytidylate kinase